MGVFLVDGVAWCAMKGTTQWRSNKGETMTLLIEAPDKFYHGEPDSCDLCGNQFSECYYDACDQLHPTAAWGNMCEPCWVKHSCGHLRIGCGQKYEYPSRKMLAGGERQGGENDPCVLGAIRKTFGADAFEAYKRGDAPLVFVNYTKKETP